MVEALRAQTVKIERERGIDPSEVAEAIATALTARRPRARYLVGRDARLRACVAALLPDRVMDRVIARALSR
jgi:hypothetical protein